MRWGPDTFCPVPSTPTQAEPDPILDNYVLLVVVMSLFVGGTLVVLSGVLLLCKRCWEVHQRFNRCMPWEPPDDMPRGACRASWWTVPIHAHPSPLFLRAMEEAEKTTTTYLDNGTHPIQGEGPARPAAPLAALDCASRRAPPLGPLPAPSGRLTVCLSVSPTRLGAVRVRLISVSLTPRRRCAQARAESE